MVALDLFDELGETITNIPKKDSLQRLCIYSEFIVTPNGELKRAICKSWVKGMKVTKVMEKKMLEMPKIDVGNEVLF